MDILTADFETHYSRTYSLSKMTTEEYVRSPEYETIGVSVKRNSEPVIWFSGTDAEIDEFLHTFDWANSVAVAHNSMFDMAILNWHYGLRPKKIVDTLSMARALHGTEVGGSLAALAQHYGIGVKGTEVLDALGKRREDFTPEELARYGNYCDNDVELTYELFKCMAPHFPVSELNLIDLTIRMFTEPKLRLDRDMLVAHLKHVRDTKQKLLDKAMVDPEQLMSNDKLADLLRSLKVEPPMKISATTGKEAYAFAKTDEAFKALLEHENPIVQFIVAARLGAKSTLEETRTERFISIADRGSLPVPLRYYAARTGRWGGSDSLNLQNLPRGSKLKKSIVAPEGYVVIDCDSSQIEARTLAWFSGQDDMVEFFRKNNEEIAAGIPKKEMKFDPYKLMASQIYGKEPTDIADIERHVGKTVVLGCGYGVGAVKLQGALKNGQVPIDLPSDECQRIISVYRESCQNIVALWKQAGNVIQAMINGSSAPLGLDGVVCVDGIGIRLPNGLYIKYPNLRKWTNNEGKTEFVYDDKKGRAVIPTRIYGGKLVENCIAEGTEVLTDRGWVYIQDVLLTDKVHDGVEFVSHGGVIAKSVQTCVSIDGVWMTPDHEVFTDEGWKAASQNPKPYRPNLWHVDGVEPRAQRWEEAELAVPMPVRDAMRQSRCWGTERGEARRLSELRVQDERTDIGGESDSWDVQASGLCSMAQHARSLPTPYPPSMEKLRRAWDNGMQSVARVFREFLVGYGAYVCARVGSEQEGQRRAVQPGELRVGHAPNKHHEQTKHHTCSGYSEVERRVGHIKIDHLLPSDPRVAHTELTNPAIVHKQVYDILNAGPRTRFVVRGGSGPFIVHNCIQALARIAVGEQMLKIAKRYKVVMTVHDAVACIAREDEADEAVAYVEECMRMRPVWAPDLPLNCESGMGRTYGDC